MDFLECVALTTMEQTCQDQHLQAAREPRQGQRIYRHTVGRPLVGFARRIRTRRASRGDADNFGQGDDGALRYRRGTPQTAVTVRAGGAFWTRKALGDPVQNASLFS